MSKILVIPDTQVKPEYDTAYLRTIGQYIADKKPDVIVMLGDFADMASLSSYDVGTKAFEGRRYRADIEATHRGMEHLLGPINEYNDTAAKNHKPRYKPRKVMLNGNHENRITRAVNQDPKLDGVLTLSDLKYEEYGWEVHDFLDVVVIDGVAFSHYFTSGVLGRPCSSAQMQLNKKHMSCVSGHQQGFQVATGHRADGKRLTSIIAGSAYEHNEDYMGPQGNSHWRGILMLHSVHEGEFDLVQVPLTYLNRRYPR